MSDSKDAGNGGQNVGRKTIRRALISVYDKTGLEDLARALFDANVEIVSTGSTAARIAELGIPVTPVDQLTGFPECLEGRVKLCIRTCMPGSSPTPASRIIAHNWPIWGWRHSNWWL